MGKNGRPYLTGEELDRFLTSFKEEVSELSTEETGGEKTLEAVLTIENSTRVAAIETASNPDEDLGNMTTPPVQPRTISLLLTLATKTTLAEPNSYEKAITGPNRDECLQQSSLAHIVRTAFGTLLTDQTRHDAHDQGGLQLQTIHKWVNRKVQGPPCCKGV